MESVIIVGVHPHSTILLHQPIDGSGAASVNLYGRITAAEIASKALLFFGVHLNPNTVAEMDNHAKPLWLAASGKQQGSLSYSYAVTGERCHGEGSCGRNFRHTGTGVIDERFGDVLLTDGGVRFNGTDTAAM